MTFAAFIEVLTAFFKFPAAVTALVKLISKTPEQNHQALIEKVNKMFDQGGNDGRPQW